MRVADTHLAEIRHQAKQTAKKGGAEKNLGPAQRIYLWGHPSP